MANLATTVNHILKTLKNHIGRGGSNAHLPVDEDIAGFMTPEMLAMLKAVSGDLKQAPVMEDVMTAPSGTYLVTGGGTRNLPFNSGYFVVSISNFLDRKVIYALHMHTGQIFVHSYNRIDGTDQTPSGWRMIVQEKEIWSGNFNTVGDTITLSDTVDRFRKIGIYYNVTPTNPNNYVEMSVGTFSKSFSIGSTNISNASGQFGVTFSEMITNDLANKKTLSIKSQKSIFLDGNSNQSLVTDKVNIFRIVGIL